ncbi:rod shape-determining protein [Hoyosella sp. YIM 151337]|uniref:rod shape-determining protein n=1 Tax=Hoyosella sp. YIM 151337 TaxID=2992742 RepID=UPI00223664A4|nr:rod shape-determining protein [Hoyosella sp. YIM 151337]MCW4353862.1 rod shape-determining protein [Hoyosella sp. YIM 151337]
MDGLGIDLGTANTVVGSPSQGIILNEPSVMLVRNKDPHRAILVGSEARQLVGRTPDGMSTVRPMRDGVIVDLDSARAYLKAIIRKVVPRWQLAVRPRGVIAVPAGATPLERRALLEVGQEAGLRKVALIPEPVAGAFGAGVNPLEPRVHLVVDIGGGTAEMTAFCFGGILAHQSCKLAGDELTSALYHYLRAEHSVVVGELTAENAKIHMHDSGGHSLVIEGRDASTGRARIVTLAPEEVADALRPTTTEIVHALAACQEELPAQAVCDVLAEGLIVIGGGALLGGLTQLLEEASGFPVKVAERPLTCVAEGATSCLSHQEVLSAFAA